MCAVHTVNGDGPNGFGPNLFGVVSRKAGAVANFHYSAVFQSSASWDRSPEVLGAFMSAPAKMVPGTPMGVFQGVADKDREDIVAYLQSQK
jgi:cytochrome c